VAPGTTRTRGVIAENRERAGEASRSDCERAKSALPIGSRSPARDAPPSGVAENAPQAHYPNNAFALSTPLTNASTSLSSLYT
jgi:hypothetical protein